MVPFDDDPNNGTSITGKKHPMKERLTYTMELRSHHLANSVRVSNLIETMLLVALPLMMAKQLVWVTTDFLPRVKNPLSGFNFIAQSHSEDITNKVTVIMIVLLLSVEVTERSAFDGDDGNGNNRYRSTGYEINPLNFSGWNHFAVSGVRK